MEKKILKIIRIFLSLMLLMGVLSYYRDDFIWESSNDIIFKENENYDSP